MIERPSSERDHTELLASERQARKEIEALYSVARALASEPHLEHVVQTVTDSATALTGAQFGAFFRVVTADSGENLVLFTLSGAERSAFERFGIPRNTLLFGPTFRGEGPVRIGDVLTDARYGKNAPYSGMPEGHLPVRSYLAVPVISRDGQVLGGLFFGHARPDVFDDGAERIAMGIAAQAAVAVENAQLNERLRTGAERLENQLNQLRLLDRITRAIDRREDLPSILEAVSRAMEAQLAIDFSCVALYESHLDTLEVIEVGEKGKSLAARFGVREGGWIPIDPNGLRGAVRGELVNLSLTGLPPDSFMRGLCEAGLCDAIVVPLMKESAVFGVLIVARRDANSFPGTECEFFRQIADHVALASHHAQLYSSLQKAYRELQQSQEKLLQQGRLRAVGQMASGIAHDINNAISPAALYTDSLLEHEPSLSPRAREWLKNVQQAIADVAQTIARMRGFYRPGGERVDQESLPLNEVVLQVIELTRPRWSDIPQGAGVSVRLSTELGADLPPIAAEGAELRDGLTNLIFNAVDAMPEGGTLTIRTRAESERVVLEVADTGVGMTEQVREHCLEPFFTTKGERGTGLGLAMVYGMAQRHDAGMDIRSSVGNGTTVSLSFRPWLAREDVRPDRRLRPALPARSKILLIDDDATLLTALGDLLRQDGHEIGIAQAGEEGVQRFAAELATERPFDLVMTDLGMPEMDGRVVAQRIRALSSTTPIVLLTGWGRRMLDENDKPEHVHRVLSKPVRIHELREVLVDLVGSTRVTPES